MQTLERINFKASKLEKKAKASIDNTKEYEDISSAQFWYQKAKISQLKNPVILIATPLQKHPQTMPANKRENNVTQFHNGKNAFNKEVIY